jgi:hypothetical protein
VQVVTGTSTTAVSNGSISKGNYVATSCAIDVAATGAPLRLEARFRANTRFGTFSATVLRDGVNVNSADATEPVWAETRSGRAVTKTEFGDVLWIDTPPAGNYHYELVVWEAQYNFTVENDKTPCLLMATEMVTQ